MEGKLIVLEGTDGSGKSTQFSLLCRRMEAEGPPFHRIVFPQYQEPSSALVRMYLGGEFGSSPSDVNPYAASTFYAVDRYAAWKKVWGRDYAAGKQILSDRYTTSNAVHQTGKLPESEWEDFLRWLFDFEYGKLGSPSPRWCCIWTCPRSRRWRTSAAGRERPTPPGISMRWTPPIWPGAGRWPTRPPSCAAGKRSPVWTGRESSAGRRRFTARSGDW